MVDSAAFDVLKFQGIVKAIAKTRHYIPEVNLKELADYEATFGHFFKEGSALIRKGTSNDKSDTENNRNLKDMVDYLNKMPDMTDRAIGILTATLNDTTKAIDNIINAS